MKHIELILDLINNDSEIALNLFLFDSYPVDTSLWTGDDVLYKNIKWLFKSTSDDFTLVGVDVNDNSVWVIDVEGGFSKACDALEYLPYEIIKTGCEYTNDGTFESYCAKKSNRGLKQILSRYEAWCNTNHIKLDQTLINLN